MGEPERLNGLLRENVVPVIGLRSPDMLQCAPRGMGVVGSDRGVILVFASRFIRAHHQVLTPECLLLGALQCPRRAAARAARPMQLYLADRGALGLPHRAGSTAFGRVRLGAGMGCRPAFSHRTVM